MALKISKGYYIIFVLLAIITALAVFWSTSHIIDQEKQSRTLRLERANRIASKELKEALNTYATLLSGLKSYVGTTSRVPNKSNVRAFMEYQMQDLDLTPPFSISYIDTSHTIVYDFVFEEGNQGLPRGTTMKSIIGLKGIKRMDTLMTKPNFYASYPTNLVEGKVGLPLGFGILDSTGQSQGYITSVALFAPIVNRVYEHVDKEKFVLSFQAGNGNYFDRSKSYNNQKAFSETSDPEYFKNFDIPLENYLYSEVPFYNKVFTVGTAYKKSYSQSIYIIFASGLCYMALLGFMLFLISRYYIYEKKNKMIAAQKQQLSELVATKNKFFSIIARDLRSPLSSVINFLDILKEEEFKSSQTNEIIASLETSSRTSISLLDNLLKWSKVQTGQIKFEPQEIDIVALTKDQIQVQKSQLEDKGINVRLESSFKNTITGDKNMLATVIRNVLSNAIKFSHLNSIIVIELSKVGEYFSFSIEDNGIGIPEKQLGELLNITKMTTQLGTRQEKGSGLGLILCDQFIKAHKGTLTIESQEGRGTIITFTLPIIDYTL